MKIWKKRWSTTDYLVPCEPWEMDVTRPACFIFPGAGTQTQREGEEKNGEGWDARRMMRRILETAHVHRDSDAVNFFMATYDEPIKEQITAARVSNMHLGGTTEEARDFVKEYLLPLMDNNQPVTLVGVSYGSVIAEQVRRALIEVFEDRKMSNDLIKMKLKTITLISASGVSDIILPDADTPRFTSFYTQFANDGMQDVLETDYKPFPHQIKERHCPEIRFPQDDIAVITGYASPIYDTENSNGEGYRMGAPGQPHALRYLLDREAGAAHGMYRSFANVLCASLARRTLRLGEMPDAIDLRAAIVQTPRFANLTQDQRDTELLEFLLEKIPFPEEQSTKWEGRVTGRSGDRAR